MARFIKQFMTEGKFDYKKFSAHRQEMMESLDTLSEEPDNEQFTQEVKTAQDKSEGKGKKAEVAKPSVQAVKQEGVEVEVFDANAINGVSVETVMEEKKWIAGAIKKSGALHKQLGVPKDEKIPAGKLEKAAEAPGKLGKRARLAQTLSKLRKEHAEQIEEAELTPKQQKIAKIAGDPHKIDQHDLKALRGGHKMKEEVEQIEERELTPAESKKKEEYVMSMKKKLPGFKERYGKRAKEVMYAVATKMAKKD